MSRGEVSWAGMTDYFKVKFSQDHIKPVEAPQLARWPDF